MQFGQAVDRVGCVGGRGVGSVEESAVPCFKVKEMICAMGGDEAGSVDVSMTVSVFLFFCFCFSRVAMRRDR